MQARDIWLVLAALGGFAVIQGALRVLKLFREYIETQKSHAAALKSMSGIAEVLKTLSDHYAKNGEPILALPEILKALVTEIHKANEVSNNMAEQIGTFRRMMFSANGDGLINQEDQERMFEDEVQEVMRKVGCDRREATARVNERRTWKRPQQEQENPYSGLESVLGE